MEGDIELDVAVGEVKVMIGQEGRTPQQCPKYGAVCARYYRTNWGLIACQYKSIQVANVPRVEILDSAPG